MYPSRPLQMKKWMTRRHCRARREIDQFCGKIENNKIYTSFALDQIKRGTIPSIILFYFLLMTRIIEKEEVFP
jgi:hypothetical protein